MKKMHVIFYTMFLGLLAISMSNYGSMKKKTTKKRIATKRIPRKKKTKVPQKKRVGRAAIKTKKSTIQKSKKVAVMNSIEFTRPDLSDDMQIKLAGVKSLNLYGKEMVIPFKIDVKAIEKELGVSLTFRQEDEEEIKKWQEKKNHLVSQNSDEDAITLAVRTIKAWFIQKLINSLLMKSEELYDQADQEKSDKKADEILKKIKEIENERDRLVAIKEVLMGMKLL